ncbi:hypothetical protein GCM10025868_36450 [Angustibacter aerolatus]|uniref:Uncharacterized protein n=1 Tax=Angustibacter aerolatus TaxID=1162965 RepID=A0ABQ6JJG6_9ACTN|nr:hypothetical protein [Angustibacter aerolatus]GMA88395.1 hypothetical protein GCM10025868_36450 [Angustibacter aerolatus]
MPGPVLWMNGDVVFDAEVLRRLLPFLESDRSAIAVNTATTAEEEVKYTVDDAGHVLALSKQVPVDAALGESVGINLVSASDRPALVRRLEECAEQDYFERGIEPGDRARRAAGDAGRHQRPLRRGGGLRRGPRAGHRRTTRVRGTREPVTGPRRSVC